MFGVNRRDAHCEGTTNDFGVVSALKKSARFWIRAMTQSATAQTILHGQPPIKPSPWGCQPSGPLGPGKIGWPQLLWIPPNFHPPICPKTIQNLFRNTKKMKKVPTTIIIHYTPTISNAFFSFNQMQPPPADRRKPRPTSNPIGHPGGGWAGRGRWDTWDSNSGRGYHGWMASGWWLDDGWWFLLPSTGSCMRLFCRWEGVKFMMFFWCDTSNTSSNDASVQYRCRSLPNTSSIPVWFWFDLHAVSALQTSVEMLRVTENLGRSTRGPADPPAPPAPPSPCWAPAAAGHALGGGGSCCRWSSGEARPGTRMACPGVGPSFPHDILWMLLLHR